MKPIILCRVGHFLTLIALGVLVGLILWLRGYAAVVVGELGSAVPIPTYYALMLSESVPLLGAALMTIAALMVGDWRIADPLLRLLVQVVLLSAWAIYAAFLLFGLYLPLVILYAPVG